MSSQPLTQLILLRHGETEWNAEGRLMNQLDGPLSPLGKRQVECLAGRVGELNIDVLYSSDLGRALETAKPIANALGIDAVRNPALQERALGIFQGLTWGEVQEQYPVEYRKYREDPDYVVPGGESAREFAARVRRVGKDLVKNHPGETIAAVTHGGVIDYFFRYVMNVPLMAPKPARLPNAGINIFEYSDSHWVLCTWGDVAHLSACFAS